MNRHHLHRSCASLYAISTCLAAVSLPAAAYAQDSASEPESVSESTQGGSGEIVVLARRREENIQDVPSSIGVLTSEELEAKNIVGFQDIKTSVANVSTTRTSTPGGGYLAIRGLSALSTPNIAIDSQIGLYVDGVYLGRAQSSGGDLTDIERVEVYRGPQGTLFGKNSTGGAINFITAAPTGEFGANFTGALGSLNRRYGKVTLNSPNLGGFSFRLTYQHEEQDGDVRNAAYGMPAHIYGGYNGGSKPVASFGRVAPSKFLGSKNSEAIVAKARYDGIDGLTIDYKYDWSNTVEAPPNIQGFGFNSTAFAATFAALHLAQQPGAQPLSFRKLKTLNQDGSGLAELEVEGHLLNIAYDVNDSTTFKSISAYRTLSSSGALDLDAGALMSNGVPIAGFHANNIIDQRQWTQEVQLIGSYDAFDYLLGGFFFHEKGEQEQLQATFVPLVPGPDGRIPVPEAAVNQIDEVNNKAYAVYGSVNVRPIPNLEASVGARYTWDRKKSTDFRFAQPVVSTFRDEQFTWDASLAYSVTPDINVYGRYAKGYNAGGTARSQPFGAEKTQSYEVGVKSELFNRKLRLNAAAFHTKSTDLQTSQFVPGVGTTYFNIGTLKIDGFEIEASARPIEGLSLTANYGYVDPTYSNGADNIQPNQTLNLSATYDTLPVFGPAYLSFRLDGSYRSKYYSSSLRDPQSRIYNPATAVALPPAIYEGYPNQEAYFNALIDAVEGGDYWLANARVSLMDIPAATGTMRITGYVKNIFDKEGITYPIDYGTIVGAVFEEERTYGIEVNLSF